jgi:hypothetical protein
MIEINVEKTEYKDVKLLKPCAMLSAGIPYGTVFQQWFEGKPSNTFFVTCGVGEKRVITFWWDDEDLEYKVSTDSKKGLKEFVPSMRVFEINAEIDIKLLH